MNYLIPSYAQDLSSGRENRYASSGHDILSLSMKQRIHTRGAFCSKIIVRRTKITVRRFTLNFKSFPPIAMSL